MKRSQALQDLVISAQNKAKENEITITEIHQQSLKDLEQNLTNLYIQSLKRTQNSIKQEMREFKESQIKNNKEKHQLIAVLSVISTALITYLLMNYFSPNTEQLQVEIQELKQSQVPKNWIQQIADSNYIVIDKNKIIQTQDSSKIAIKLEN